MSQFRSRAATTVAALSLFVSTASSQTLPESGVSGVDLVYATSPAGSSQLYAVSLTTSAAPIPVGAPVSAVPSRWAHRRRTLGALETSIAYAPPFVVMTPMGDAVGNGAIHLIDARAGGLASQLVPTQNPAGYDLAVVESLEYVFALEDDGAGGSTLRGFSYGSVGQLQALSPPTLALSGPPSSYVNRIGIDLDNLELHVLTTDGVHVVSLSASAPNMAVSQSYATSPLVPTTNPIAFELNGSTRWIVGMCEFTAPPTVVPREAGFFQWDRSGNASGGVFGDVPTAPGKRWVPAAGAEELAVISSGSETYAYYLLREPPPGTFFIKPSAIGAVRLQVAGITSGTILCPDSCGEPFANPTVSGTRVALESSLGEPFISVPPGGAEKISILYSPLDPLGAGSTFGVLAVPGPLGGRISTKGMERPMWSRDGSRVISTTSHFPGAPNPGLPGIEVFEVPDATPVNEFMSPHQVVPNLQSPNRSIIFPSAFQPRVPAFAAAVDGLSFVGNVFADGMAAACLTPYGEVGQFHKEAQAFVQSPAVPNFPAILPPSFLDASGSVTPVPPTFGARRTSFNLIPGLGLSGVTMIAAVDAELMVQPTGYNTLAALLPLSPVAPFRIALPNGWLTTTEFLSL